MRINGNLELNGLGQSEIQNAVIERVSQLPSFSSVEKGRFVFYTVDSRVYYNDGSSWSPFATGGNASALQGEVDALETALGALFKSDGTWDSVGVTFTALPGGASSLSDLMSQVDALLKTQGAHLTALDTEYAVLQASLATEASNRQTADSALQASVTSQIQTLSQSLNSQLTGVQASLATETTSRQAGDALLQAAIDSETSGRKAADAII
jgi:hypothetical protein